MTDRPILFSAPMVRALLAGTKTQTRRVVKIQPPEDCGPIDCGPYHPTIIDHHGDAQPGPEIFGAYDAWGEWGARCPYGQPGDRLYVRETWQAVKGNDRARHIVTHPAPDRGWIEYAATPRDDEPAYKWRPSIHMPRWASRITLEITSVRVERLQGISEADAIAEGISEFIGGWWCEHDDAEQIAGMTPQEGYRHLWERINGPGSWGANPWVWVIEFKRVTP